MSRSAQLVLVALVGATVVSALSVVYVKHQNRKAIAELAALRTERDVLEVEWDRLLLEQSAWATPPRIEQLARDQLGMVLPEPERILVVRP